MQALWGTLQQGDGRIPAIIVNWRLRHRYPQYIAALMQRFGGHPYETMDMLPFNVVDPVKKTPLENLWHMGHNRNELVGAAPCLDLKVEKMCVSHLVVHLA